jgi:uncharacterized phage protein (TIGR02216 family)
LIAFAVGRLGWTPPVFWAATPRELAAVLGALVPATGATGRAELDALIARFPDGSRP